MNLARRVSRCRTFSNTLSLTRYQRINLGVDPSVTIHVAANQIFEEQVAVACLEEWRLNCAVSCKYFAHIVGVIPTGGAPFTMYKCGLDGVSYTWLI